MRSIRRVSACAAAVLACVPPAAGAVAFTQGSLVVAVSGRAGGTGTYGDNQASPLSLFQYTPTGTTGASFLPQATLVLPQVASGANYAFSAEYGSSSEGMLQLSGDGTALAIAGYGVNAAAFNANPAGYGSNDPSKPGALAQSTSLAAPSATTPVPRVVALIGADGSVDTSTGLYNVFDTNNPRAAYTLDGKAIYVSGQGSGSDATGGVFYAARGASGATAITGKDTSGKTIAQDTRDVQVVNGTLYASVDTKGGSGSARDFVGTLGTPPATGLYDGGNGPTQLGGFGTSASGKLTLTAAQGNGLNMAGQQINLSPEQFFFANPTTLYVADSGAPKNNSGSSTLGDGGLQKWTFNGTTWLLAYTLADGLGLVPNPASNGPAGGTTGLFALAGQVVGDQVQLYATNYTTGDLDQTYLYGITDSLSATSGAGERFSQLAAAPADSKFRGVAFAPSAAVPEPGTYGMAIVGFGLLGAALRRRRRPESVQCA